MNRASERPLTNPVFRALWIATLVSNTGTWMHDVGAGWLMTSLSTDPLMVALVQAATTLPLFVLALPAGALADILDRRKLLIGAHVFGLAATLLLATATPLGLTSAWGLLCLTAMISVGAALSAPAFQAIVSELVGGPALQKAVTLNSLSVNIARAVGPALGGVIIAAAGSSAVFALNAVSMLGVIVVLARWRRPAPDRHLPPEHFIAAMRAGLRYALQAREFQAVLVRSAGFFLFASCLWALLPIIGRRELELGAAGYGGMLAFLGLGAIFGAVSLPQLRAQLSANGLAVTATLLLAIAMAGLSQASSFGTAAMVLFAGGTAWIIMIASLTGGAQASSPNWVKARAVALFIVVFQGSMTAGAILWGALASHIGVAHTLLWAAAALTAATLKLAWRHPLHDLARLDLSPSLHWPVPLIVQDVAEDRGPVLVTIEYRVDPERVDEFSRAMQGVRRIRLRDGAIQWGLYEDASASGVLVEAFTVQSWTDHLRQHDRVTNADRVQQDSLRDLMSNSSTPIVRHLIAR